jgi:hypothetical protein
MADFGEAALRGGLSFCGVAFANVYYWHLADNPVTLAFVRFWTKADIGVDCSNPYRYMAPARQLPIPDLTLALFGNQSKDTCQA